MLVTVDRVLLALRVLLEDLMGLGSQWVELIAPARYFNGLVDVHPVMKSNEYTNKNYCRYMDICASMLQPHVLDQLLEVGVLLALFVVGGAQEAEVVRHYEVPLLQFVQHLDLFDLQAFCLVDAVVVAMVGGFFTSVAW